MAERIKDYRAMYVADWVMYRQSLAAAARAPGWSVHRYAAKRVFTEAAWALKRATLDDLLHATKRSVGPPWQKDHRMAMAATIAAAHDEGSEHEVEHDDPFEGR